MRSMTRVTALSEWTLRTGLHFPFEEDSYRIRPHWEVCSHARSAWRFFSLQFLPNPPFGGSRDRILPHYFVLCPLVSRIRVADPEGANLARWRARPFARSSPAGQGADCPASALPLATSIGTNPCAWHLAHSLCWLAPSSVLPHLPPRPHRPSIFYHLPTPKHLPIMAATAVANNPEDIVAASYVGFDCACPSSSTLLTLQRSPGRSNTSFSSAVSSSMSWLSVRIHASSRRPDTWT